MSSKRLKGVPILRTVISQFYGLSLTIKRSDFGMNTWVVAILSQNGGYHRRGTTTVNLNEPTLRRYFFMGGLV
jgi:hypothetical protein